MTNFPEPTAFPPGASFADGVWTQPLSSLEKTQGRPALFLDRDGVVVEDAHYLSKAEDVQLTPNATALIKAANDKNVPVILVTNQAGIGYGYFKWDAFIEVQARISRDLSGGGAHIDGVYACPFHVKGKGVYAHDNHPARKPNPGMLWLARDQMGIDITRSWIVGDRALDLLAAKNAGAAGGVHVLTGHGSVEGERDAALNVASDSFTVRESDNLGAALSLIPLLVPLLVPLLD